MKDRNIIQSDVVWMQAENEALTASSYHGYYPSERLRPYTRERYNANRALCNRKFGISDDGEYYVHISKVVDDGLDRDKVCKKCLNIFDKIPAQPFHTAPCPKSDT